MGTLLTIAAAVATLVLLVRDRVRAKRHADATAKLSAFENAFEALGDAIDAHEHGASFYESYLAAKKGPAAQAIVEDMYEEGSAIAARLRGSVKLPVVLLFAIALLGSGCTAAQLQQDEAVAHGLLVKLKSGIDWAKANPEIVTTLLDEAAAKSTSPALSAAIAKAKEHVAAGDLDKASDALDHGIALTAAAAQ